MKPAFPLFRLAALAMTLLVSLAAARAQDANTNADKPLSAYRDKNRVLLVFTPTAQDSAYLEQTKLWQNEKSGFDERQLVVVPVPADAKKAGGGRSAGNAGERFGVDAKTFAVVLVGKDGHDAYRSPKPVPAATLYGVIDAMPMRRAEMKRSPSPRPRPPPAPPPPSPTLTTTSDVADGPPMNLADQRKNYLRGQLRRADLQSDPIQQFQRWMQEAHDANVVEPTAMSLGTTGGDGVPRVRTVLLKGLDTRGFVFYTNFGSRKGRQLGENPRASLLFPWLALERQVLVIGAVERIDDAETRAYFHSRPRESQLAAWASQQSDVVTSRAALDAGLEEVRQRFGTIAGEVPVPPFWGGYRVKPATVEFWQGRANRMHDRFEYTRQPTGVWTMARLSP